MEYFPSEVTKIINKLNENLSSLNVSIDKFSNASNKLQERLIFWTKVMAWAIIVQVIVIIATTFFR